MIKFKPLCTFCLASSSIYFFHASLFFSSFLHLYLLAISSLLLIHNILICPHSQCNWRPGACNSSKKKPNTNWKVTAAAYWHGVSHHPGSAQLHGHCCYGLCVSSLRTCTACTWWPKTGQGQQTFSVRTRCFRFVPTCLSKIEILFLYMLSINHRSTSRSTVIAYYNYYYCELLLYILIVQSCWNSRVNLWNIPHVS